MVGGKGDNSEAKKRKGRKLLLNETLSREVKRSVDKESVTKFTELEERFIKECEMKDYSPSTIVFYHRELKYVKRLLVDVEASLDDIKSITIDHIYGMIQLQKDRGLKMMTIHTRLRALRALLNWAVMRGLLDKSPMADIGLPKIKHQVGATFTKSQLKRLLNAPDLQTFIGLRDYVLMLTFAHTGARVSEIADLSVRSVNFEESAITFTRTKNGKVRRIPMTHQLKKAMKMWFKVRGVDIDTDALFITHFDEPMVARAMQRRLKAYGEQTGVEKEVPVSPHAFRRTFAKLKVQSGVDIFTVQALMGHSSLDQLKQYVMLYSEDLVKGIEAGTDLD